MRRGSGLVGLDYFLNKRMPNHVLVREHEDGNPLDVGQDVACLHQTGSGPFREVYLGYVSRNDSF